MLQDTDLVSPGDVEWEPPYVFLSGREINDVIHALQRIREVKNSDLDDIEDMLCSLLRKIGIPEHYISLVPQVK